MHKICSDESKCAVIKGCLCSDKKGQSEICLGKETYFGKKGHSKIGIQLLRSKCALCSDEFSLKHALMHTCKSRTVFKNARPIYQKAYSGAVCYTCKSFDYYVPLC